MAGEKYIFERHGKRYVTKLTYVSGGRQIVANTRSGLRGWPSLNYVYRLIVARNDDSPRGLSRAFAFAPLSNLIGAG